MTKPKPLVTWDTCVILWAMEKDAVRYPPIATLEERARQEKLGIVIPVVCVAEVLYIGQDKKPSAGERVPMTEDQLRAIDQWFDNTYITVRNVDRRIAKKAAELRREFRLTTPDALVLATAILEDTTVLFTNDGANEGGTKKNKPNLIELNGRVPPLQIVVPSHQAVGLLPGLQEDAP